MEVEKEIIELPDPDEINDIETMRVLVKHLIAAVQSQQSTIEQLRNSIEKKDAEIAELKRMLFGKKSERMTGVDEEIKKRRKKNAGARKKDKKKSRNRRRRNREAKKELPTEEVVHEVAEEDCVCPHCGGTRFSDLGEGEVSYEYEYIPARIVRFKHIRKNKACACGQYIVTAPPPERVSDGVQYGPGFHAHVAVSKCSDSIPLYRQAKQFNREGVPVCRSTLCDLFHRSAELLSPLHKRIMELISKSPYVNADETPVPVQDNEKTRRAYMWDFIAGNMVGYMYSPSRSGETPVNVLGQSKGFLQVDAYSGYNQVTRPESRTRVGCIAHVRRYFWKAKETEPENAQYVLDRILELYEVEYQAADEGILGTDRHLALRNAVSGLVMKELKQWLDEQEPVHPPKSPLGQAITYIRKNWESLNQFLKDPKLSLDNNISERHLRLIALGRKNFLFVGHDEAGENLAVLQTLVSTCELNGVNPQAYLTDVLIRTQTHPASRIDDLLPQNWSPPDDAPD